VGARSLEQVSNAAATSPRQSAHSSVVSIWLASRLVGRDSARPTEFAGAGGLLSNEAQAAAGSGLSRSVTPGSFLWFMDFKHHERSGKESLKVT
jgi:hypothetical protein